MRRGEIYIVDWEPSIKGEPAFKRPAVILTDNDANDFLPHIVVAPLTSNISHIYHFDILLPIGCCGLRESSKIQLNYIRGLNRSRVSKYLGSVPQELMFEVNEKLREHLGL